MPLVIICSLLLAAAFVRSKTWKTRFFRASLILLLFWSNDFITNEFIKAWEIPAIPLAAMTKKYEWGILLSGVLKADTEPKDRVYFYRGADRVTHTFQLYKQGYIRKILVSGGSGRLSDIGEREADEIARLLIMMGVKPEDILTDNESRNTHESSINVKAILQDSIRSSDCLLITSAFHMRRSAACFRKAGFGMDEFSTDFLSHRRSYAPGVMIVPEVDALMIWHHLIKEWVGYLAYAAAGYI